MKREETLFSALIMCVMPAHTTIKQCSHHYLVSEPSGWAGKTNHTVVVWCGDETWGNVVSKPATYHLTSMSCMYAPVAASIILESN